MFSDVHSGTPSSLISVKKCSTKSCVNTVACFQEIKESPLAGYAIWQSWHVFLLRGLLTVRLQDWVWNEWKADSIFVLQEGVISWESNKVTLSVSINYLSPLNPALLESFPGVWSWKQGYTLDKCPVYHRVAQRDERPVKLTVKDNSEFAISLMLLNRGSTLDGLVCRKARDPWPCCEAD